MKIAVLVSGGVDSSVALQRLLQAGHDVHAFYLKIWLEDELAFLGECPWEEDLRYVRSVCERLGVPLSIIPLQREYHERVIRFALEETRAGRTPNPDMLCNQHIKFGAFFDAIDESYEKVATGHYAQVEEKRGVFRLKRSPDPVKDQTYFLSQLSQAQLSRALFPIGSFVKEEVRKLAEAFDLPTKNRPDSQGLCFLGKINFQEFVEHHLGKQKGDIIEKETGKKLGEHEGFWFYTIGQRRQIGLSGGPWYIVQKDTEKNILFVSHRLRMTREERDTFEVVRTRWNGPAMVAGDSQSLPKRGRLQVKVRHGALLYPCALEPLEEAGAWRVRLLQGKDRGIAPGQFAVFYDGKYCLGGGVIA